MRKKERTNVLRKLFQIWAWIDEQTIQIDEMTTENGTEAVMNQLKKHH